MRAERWNLQPQAELSTARADVLVARLAARHHGVLSADELLACGLTPDGIFVRTRNGRLHPMHKGVYAVGHSNPTRDGWFPDVLVLGESAPQHPRIKGHRTSYLPQHHVTTVRGIPVTTAERTLLDLAAVLPERKLRRAVRQAQFL